MITIVCWKWAGYRNTYSARHVNALHAMLHATMSTPFRLICLTDDPSGIVADVEARPIPEIAVAAAGHHANCFHRVALLDPGFCSWLDPRGVLSIDLDCVIERSLAPLIPPGFVDFKILSGYAGPYNGSLVWARPSPANAAAFAPWKRDRAAAIRACVESGMTGSDQVYFARHRPGAPTWGPKDGVRQHARKDGAGCRPARVTFFAGPEKPWEHPLWLEYAPAAHQPRHALWTPDDLGSMLWSPEHGMGRIDRVMDGEVQVRFGPHHLRSYCAEDGHPVGHPGVDPAVCIRRLS